MAKWLRNSKFTLKFSLKIIQYIFIFRTPLVKIMDPSRVWRRLIGANFFKSECVPKVLDWIRPLNIHLVVFHFLHHWGIIIWCLTETCLIMIFQFFWAVMSKILNVVSFFTVLMPLSDHLQVGNEDYMFELVRNHQCCGILLGYMND